VRRGSSFRNFDRNSTLASIRDNNEPDYRRSNIGFRCVLATAP
jgi:formylglycine-generating enzyme required for sulfatase activity